MEDVGPRGPSSPADSTRGAGPRGPGARLRLRDTGGPGFGLLPLYDVEEKHQVHVNRLETMLVLSCRHNFSRSGTVDLIHGELGCVISILSLFLTRRMLELMLI